MSLDTPDHALLQDRLIRFLEEITPAFEAELGPKAELFGDGRLDSLALVQLVVWVEEETGTPVEPTLDPKQEWATVADLVAFIDRRVARAPQPPRP